MQNLSGFKAQAQLERFYGDFGWRRAGILKAFLGSRYFLLIGLGIELKIDNLFR